MVTATEPRRFPRVEYSGIYDFELLIEMIKTWFDERFYVRINTEHTEAFKPQGRDIRIQMSPFKNVTPYVRYFIQFDMEFWREIDVMVKEDGKQVKKQRGDMDFRFKAFFLKNFKQTFPSNKFGNFFRELYEKYIIKQELKNHEEQLREEVYELMDKVKEILGLYKRKGDEVTIIQ